jgi:hypothetical protein
MCCDLVRLASVLVRPPLAVSRRLVALSRRVLLRLRAVSRRLAVRVAVHRAATISRRLAALVR